MCSHCYEKREGGGRTVTDRQKGGGGGGERERERERESGRVILLISV